MTSRDDVTYEETETVLSYSVNIRTITCMLQSLCSGIVGRWIYFLTSSFGILHFSIRTS